MASNEYHILLAAGRIDPAADDHAKLQHYLGCAVDGDRLVDLAVREGVAGLLYKNLLKTGLIKHLDPAQAQRLHSLYYLNLRNNLKLIHDLKEILQRLERHKVRVVVMQGMALLQQLYSDVGQRPLTDIDLWVLPEDHAKLAQTLTDLSYKIDTVYPDTYRKGSTIVDVNTHILWADRIKARRRLLDRSQEDIYGSCRIIDCEGVRCRCLNKHDQALYLCLHALKHFGERLIWLADIRELTLPWAPDDWNSLAERAGAMGQQKTVACIFYLLENLFDDQLPAEAHILFGKNRLSHLEKMVLKKRFDGHPLPQWSPLLLLGGGKSPGIRLAFGFESLFPRPEILRQVFANHPDLKNWQLYWKRALQLLGAIK